MRRENVCEALTSYQPTATCCHNNNRNSKGSRSGVFVQLSCLVIYFRMAWRSTSFQRASNTTEMFWVETTTTQTIVAHSWASARVCRHICTQMCLLACGAHITTTTIANNKNSQLELLLFFLFCSASADLRHRHRGRHRHRRSREAEQRCQAMSARLVLFQCSCRSGRRTRIRQYNSA